MRTTLRGRAVASAVTLALAAAGLAASAPVSAQTGLNGTAPLDCPAEAHLVDCFKVAASAVAGAKSRDLPKGVYRVVSSGTWQNNVDGVTSLVDAECTDAGTAGFLRGVDGADDTLDLVVQGKPQTWIPLVPTITGCNPTDTRFETYVEHVGGQIPFKVNDNQPTDNIGKLEIKIYDAAAELGVPIQSVAGIVLIDPKNQQPVAVPALKWSKAVVAVRGLYQWSIKPENQADAECARTEGAWSAEAIKQDPLYEPYHGQDYLDVHVDGRDQHLKPPAPTPGADANCDVITHAYVHPATPMLVESDAVRFRVFDWAYWDNTGLLFGVVLISVPPLNPAATNFSFITTGATSTDLPPKTQPPLAVEIGKPGETMTLEPGVYEVRASGVWKNGNVLQDAECLSNLAKDKWDRDDAQNNLGNGDLQIDDRLTEWVPVGVDGTGCSPANTYRTYVDLPSAAKIKLAVDDSDDSSTNNTAAPLTVSFKKITGVLLGTSDSSIVKSVSGAGRPAAVYGDYELNTTIEFKGGGGALPVEQLILSEGTFRYRHFNEADAECSYAKPRNWTETQEGVDNPDLVIDSAEVTWAPSTFTGNGGPETDCPMGGHERWTRTTTTAASFTARIQDTWHGDNDGALVVTAFKLG